MEKVVLTLLHLKWLGLTVEGTYHWKLRKPINLELYFKCKYMYVDSLNCQLFKKKKYYKVIARNLDDRFTLTVDYVYEL